MTERRLSLRVFAALLSQWARVNYSSRGFGANRTTANGPLDRPIRGLSASFRTHACGATARANAAHTIIDDYAGKQNSKFQTIIDPQLPARKLGVSDFWTCQFLSSPELSELHIPETLLNT